MACIGSLCTPGTPPQERAAACIDFCKLVHPEYFRSTLLANAYRSCLDGCSGMQDTPADEVNWPSDMLAAAGQDLREVHQALRFDLVILAGIVLGVLLITRRLT